MSRLISNEDYQTHLKGFFISDGCIARKNSIAFVLREDGSTWEQENAERNPETRLFYTFPSGDKDSPAWLLLN